MLFGRVPWFIGQVLRYHNAFLRINKLFALTKFFFLLRLFVLERTVRCVRGACWRCFRGVLGSLLMIWGCDVILMRK